MPARMLSLTSNPNLKPSDGGPLNPFFVFSLMTMPRKNLLIRDAPTGNYRPSMRTLRFLRLRVEDCTAIKGNCETVIYWTSNSEDLLVCPMANSCIRNRPDNLVLESKQMIRG